jgi:hypothetical protein
MLSRIIVSSWAVLIEISLWLLLLAALVGGWQAGGIGGAIGGLVVAFIIGSMFLGAFLVLEDIRKSVKAIENRK